MSSTTTAESRRIKSRSSIACQNCRTRKVRCNVIQHGPPCTNCRLDGTDCIIGESRRRVPQNLGPDGNQNIAQPRFSPTLPSFIQPLPAHLTQEDLLYLDHNRVFAIPDESIVRVLTGACLTYGGYFMPSLDRCTLDHCDTRGKRHDSQDLKQGLLELYAMMFVGSAFVDLWVIQAAGFDTRKSARYSFYHRAKMLYDFDVEDNQLVVLQSLLFISFWYEDEKHRKDAWYWTGAAAASLQILGVSESAHSETSRSRKFKRLWWSCYVRDTLVALAMRLPPRLQYPVPMLTLDDFETCDCDGVAKHLHDDRIMTYIAMAELTVCISHVLSTPDSHRRSRPDAEIQALNAQFDNWFQDQCTQLLLHKATVHLEADKADREKANAVSRILLGMTYYASLSVLHLPRALATVPARDLGQVQDMAAYESYKVLQVSAHEISYLAAQSINQDLVAYIPTQGITCLLPATSTHLLNLKTLRGSNREDTLSKLRPCIRFLQILQQRYAVLDSILDHLAGSLRELNVAEDINASIADSERPVDVIPDIVQGSPWQEPIVDKTPYHNDAEDQLMAYVDSNEFMFHSQEDESNERSRVDSVGLEAYADVAPLDVEALESMYLSWSTNIDGTIE